jgi:hypothetical protein
VAGLEEVSELDVGSGLGELDHIVHGTVVLSDLVTAPEVGKRVTC